MKKNEKTTVGKLKPGDAFTLVRGGIHFEKLKGKTKEKNCLCTIRGSKDRQSLPPDFPAYFVSHKKSDNDKKSIARKKRTFIQLSFPFQLEQPHPISGIV